MNTVLRRPIIAGNWKMHGTQQFADAFLQSFIAANFHSDILDVFLFPPYVFLERFQNTLHGLPIYWGGQNISSQAEGPYTGEISGPMLRDLGCRIVLVGHSERRTLFHETDALIAKKILCALESGLSPVLCVGESLSERNAGKTLGVVFSQVDAVLDILMPEQLHSLIVAYEPIWAIGTGIVARPDVAQEVHAALRSHIAQRDRLASQSLRILYGGSVNTSNATELFAMPDIDGALVGGASLDVKAFLTLGDYLCASCC